MEGTELTIIEKPVDVIRRKRNNPFHEKAYNWRGGRHIRSDGYVQIMIYPDHIYYLMGKRTQGLGRQVMEHRLIMAQHLKRLLLKTEQVHHTNGVRDDNRLENLELMPNLGQHTKVMVCAKCELRKEIRLLRWQIKELTSAVQLKLKEEGELNE